jgi:HD-like signal output (HDOD) protein/CheY-like chemotaxis protein
LPGISVAGNHEGPAFPLLSLRILGFDPRAGPVGFGIGTQYAVSKLLFFEMTKQILLVGEEQPLWEDVRTFCEQPGSGWRAEFVQTGLEALALFAQHRFEAVVADVQLSDMSGVALLDDIMRWRANAIRIVLSDMADTESTVKCIGTGHHHLLKPCDAGTLWDALNQALTQETWLPSETVQDLVAQMRRVPSPPGIYFQIIEELQSPNASVERIGEFIRTDPAITAKVMQLANSAVFGLHLQVIHPVEAVAYLGLETTKALVLLAHAFCVFDQVKLKGFSMEALWRHSVLTGRFARRIVQVEDRGPEPAEQASAGGLLHDIGQVLFAANLPESFGKALTMAHERKCRLLEAENVVFGASHAELGAYLLGIWGLPRPIVEAVALHHHPSQLIGQGFGPITAVHVANVLAHEACPEDPALAQADLDMDHLRELDLESRVEEWRQRCLAGEEEVAA